SGVRYDYCQDVLSPDIYDPVKLTGSGYYHPDPVNFQIPGSPPDDPNRAGEFVQPPIGVPYHAHWYDYDPTDPPPPWSPRRTEWKELLVDRKPDTSAPVGFFHSPANDQTLKEDRDALVTALNDAAFSDEVHSFATTPRPFAIWKPAAGCPESALASEKKVSDLPAPLPTWISAYKPAIAPSAPVYRA